MFDISVMAAIDVKELQKQELSETTVESWCIEDQAMEVDIALLRQVEALERKVISASLQVKVQANKPPHVVFKLNVMSVNTVL